MNEPYSDFFEHVQHMQEYLQLNLSEADTRVYLVDPVLRILGYVRVGDLRREVPVPATREFLDYELYADGKGQAIVEAKSLRTPLTDQVAAQCVQYAAVLGVRWCLITNGMGWAVYNAHASGPLADKKVAMVRLDPDEASIREAWSVLSLFSKTSLVNSSPMSRLLAARVVEDELNRPDSPAVTALRKAIRDRFGERVAPQAIVDVVAELMSKAKTTSHSGHGLESNELTSAPTPTDGEPQDVTLLDSVPGQRARRSEVVKPDGTRVTLADLIASDILPLGAAIEGEFKKVTHIARIVPQGIELGGVQYANLSAAGKAANNGGAANGWVSWCYQGRPLDELRREFLARVNGIASQSG